MLLADWSCGGDDFWRRDEDDEDIFPGAPGVVSRHNCFGRTEGCADHLLLASGYRQNGFVRTRRVRTTSSLARFQHAQDFFHLQLLLAAQIHHALRRVAGGALDLAAGDEMLAAQRAHPLGLTGAE